VKKLQELHKELKIQKLGLAQFDYQQDVFLIIIFFLKKEMK